MEEKVNFEAEKYQSTYEQQRTLILSYRDTLTQLET